MTIDGHGALHLQMLLSHTSCDLFEYGMQLNTTAGYNKQPIDVFNVMN